MAAAGSTTRESAAIVVTFWIHVETSHSFFSQITAFITYVGYFINGIRTGKGELEYSKRKKIRKKKPVVEEVVEEESVEEDGETTKTVKPQKTKEEIEEEKFDKLRSEFKSRYQGYFIANNIASGGVIMDTVEELPLCIAKRDKRAMYPITSFFQKIEKSQKEIRWKIEKMADMEHQIRQEVHHKKTKVFRQQKHFTKKAIYDDEVKPYRQARVTVREKVKKRLSNKGTTFIHFYFLFFQVRKERMAKISPIDANSQKGLSSVWTAIDVKGASHLQEVFKKIKIERHKGESKKPVKTVIPRSIFIQHPSVHYEFSEHLRSNPLCLVDWRYPISRRFMKSSGS